MIRAQRAWQKTGAFSGLFLLLISWGQTWAGSSLASLELESLQLGASQLEWSRALGLTRHPLAGMSGSWLQGKYRGGAARVWIGTSSLSTKPSLASVRQEWADALNAQRSATPGILISDQGCAILSDGSYQCRSDSRLPATGKRPEEFLSQSLTWNPGQERVLIQGRTPGSADIARKLLAEFSFRPKRANPVGGKR